VGTVADYEAGSGQVKILVRNYFETGNQLEVLDPHAPDIKRFKVELIKRDNGEIIEKAHNQYTVFLKVPEPLSTGSIIRRKK
jgi:hypothetical protein